MVGAIVACIAISGCYFTKYDKLARTHVEVLLGMTGKIQDVAARDGNDSLALGEYRYPLERARDFIRITSRRYDGRESLRMLRTLCDAYERVLTAADRLPDDDAHTPLIAAAAEVRARAGEVIAALDREQRA